MCCGPALSAACARRVRWQFTWPVAVAGATVAERQGKTRMDNQMEIQISSNRLKSLAEFRFQLRKFLNFSETASERAGIPTQQYQLMQVIASVPEGQQPSISHLAERMVLRHNSTVELVDRAERAGLVRRQHDDRDLRRSLVY